MPFPPTPRVLYAKNPLEEVVCQLRFPPILRIDAETPVAFQEAVRDIFPLYQRVGSRAVMPLGLPPDLLQMLGGAAGAVHEFASADQIWKLSLARDFIALTTRSYREWSEFKSKLQGPLDALCSNYQPAFFVRIGLRYRDKVDREAFGLEGTAWRELLRAEALGELGDPNIGSQIQHVLRELIVRLPDEAGQVRIVHGLQTESSKSTYVIDADFFTDAQTETKGVSDVLNAFNRRAGHLFRWYITTTLHNAMDPQSV